MTTRKPSQPASQPSVEAPSLDPDAESRVQDAIGTIRAHAKLTDATALKGPVRVISIPTLRLIVQALIKEAETDEGTAQMVQEAAEARLERDQAFNKIESLQRKIDDVSRERDEIQELLDTLQEDVTGKSVRLASVDREREELAARLQAQELELTAVHEDREALSLRIAALEERLGLASSELDVARQEADLVVESAETAESRRLRLESDAARLSRRRETLMLERGMLTKSTEELVSIVMELREQLRHEREAVESLERQIAGYREREEARSKRSGTRIMGMEDRNKALIEAMERLENDLASERKRHEEDVSRLEADIERLHAANLSARFPRKSPAFEGGGV